MSNEDEIDEFLENIRVNSILVKAENSVTERNVYTEPCIRLLKPELIALKKKWETEARIDELKHIVSGSENSADDFDWYEKTRDEYIGTHYYSEVHHLNSKERINQLTNGDK